MTAIVGLSLELPFYPMGASAPGMVAFQLNQSTDAFEVIFQAQEDITCTRLGIYQGTITGTAPFYKLSLQGVANGIPDGTILGGGSPASVTFQPVGGDSNAWIWKTLDNSIALTRGTFYSLVLAHASGTIDGSNRVGFGSTSGHSATVGIPYSINNDNGVRGNNNTSPPFGYGSASVAYGFPTKTADQLSFSSASTPDERGNLITIPTTWWSSYKIIGAAIYGAHAAATTYDLVLYDTDGTTVLQTVNIDTDNDSSPASVRRRMILFDESTLSTLNAGSSYRLVFKPAGTSLTLCGFGVAVTADLDAYLGGAAICQGTTRTDGGSWTDNNIYRYGINPILADITAPSSGGGLLLPRTFNGGLV